MRHSRLGTVRPPLKGLKVLPVGVTVAAVLAPQSMRVMGPELVAPEAGRLVGDEDPSPSQEVLDVSMADIEAVIEPNGVLDDLRRKSVPPVEAL